MKTNFTIINRFKGIGIIFLFVFCFAFNSNAVNVHKVFEIADSCDQTLDGFHIIFMQLEPIDSLEDGLIDSSIPFSPIEVVEWGDYSSSVRFIKQDAGTPGTIDIRNGAEGFSVDEELTFEFGDVFNVWLELDVDSKNYSVHVENITQDKGNIILAAEYYEFRNTDLTELVYCSVLTGDTDPGYVNIKMFHLVNEIGEFSRVGVKDISSSNKIETFPNPFEDEFNIKLNGQFTYTIMNITGSEIQKGTALNQTKIGTELKRGCYFVKIQQGNEIYTTKMIKQ